MDDSVDKGKKGGNRRFWIFAISLVCLFGATFLAKATKEYNYKATAAEHLTLVVDSIDFRSDLTRIYGRLIGRPHTSQRIDAMAFEVNGRRMEASDIDGVDFKRWFQWEDDGVINVEVDFPMMSEFESGTLHISTPRGLDRCTVSR